MYSKTKWLPRLGVGLNKFFNSGTTQKLELTPAPDEITQPGTPFSADLMNHLEAGVEQAHMLAGGIVAEVTAGEDISACDIVDVIDNIAYKYTGSAFYTGETVCFDPDAQETGILTALSSETFVSITYGARIIRRTREEYTIGDEFQFWDTPPKHIAKVAALSEASFALVNKFPDGTAGVIIGTIDNTDITFHAPAIYDTENASSSCDITALSSDTVVIVYRDNDNNYYGTAIVGKIVDNAVQFGAPVVFESTAISIPDCVRLSDSSCIVSYTDGYGRTCCRILRSDGNVVSFGDVAILEHSVCNYTVVTTLSENAAVVAFSDVESRVKAVQVAINDNTITSIGNTIICGNTLSEGGKRLRILNDRNTQAALFFADADKDALITMLLTPSKKGLSAGGAFICGNPLWSASAATISSGLIMVSSDVGEVSVITTPLPRAIAANSAAQNERLHAAFNGNVQIDGISEGTIINSTGVSAFAYTDGYAAVRCWCISGINSIAENIYPIGAIYISATADSPALLFGGAWEQVKDAFLLAAGDTYAAGSTGGEAAHTLTVDEMPSHTHMSVYNDEFASVQETAANAFVESCFETNVTNYRATSYKSVMETGGSQPHNNMPPYLAVYIWKRIA